MSEAVAQDFSTELDVRPLSGSMGAEIFGVDLSALDDAGFAEIYRAFVRYQVIFFRDQVLTPEQYLVFAKRWGGIHQHPFMKHLDDYPGILEIVKTETDTKAFGSSWHSDQMFTQKPAKCTMLYAKEVPERGGDTMFANMYDGHDALSTGMRAMLANLKGWNTGDREKLRGQKASAPDPTVAMSKMTEKAPGDVQTESAHPILRTHKDTGRKALYIGGHTLKIDGWTDAESEPLLTFLKAHAVRPEFTCRFRWQVGSLAIWDNRCVQHFAVDDYAGQRRRMHRITIQGEEIPF
ncbi:MAG: TauD/TfdA family dioxygenase [Gammaproteobacteria bacterium]|nr:TauD/TfdA family dioxygenase [Gammaproteobacteria bacterium]